MDRFSVLGFHGHNLCGRNGIMQTTSNEMPLVSLFGADLERVLRDAILAVGNFDEMYRRVLGQNASQKCAQCFTISTMIIYPFEDILQMGPD
ncbi:hypothetical protein ACHAXR_010364 [Thalassiosira sp. AJA248-18]